MKKSSYYLIIYLLCCCSSKELMLEDGVESGKSTKKYSVKLSKQNKHSKIIRFQDINFKNALIEIGIDKNRDGEIQKSEVKFIRQLEISRKKISSLAEIIYFKNLEILNCMNNRLKKLNLSKNLKLRSLGCKNNILTSLITSNNSLLETLNCSNNQLTNLDLSYNTKIRGLMCSNNQLISLNLSKNNNLEVLICENNALSCIKVPSNIINKKRFWYKDNKTIYSTDCYN
ncbi:hypothetical protein [Tenacibaculum sp. C7A-26P2]|uniref:hypothetical protein n=1 Tax=Tenacibaculum sp. C7A-26P2 TaxID=3447504 RepID=UPI003F8611AF